LGYCVLSACSKALSLSLLFLHIYFSPDRDPCIADLKAIDSFNVANPSGEFSKKIADLHAQYFMCDKDTSSCAEMVAELKSLVKVVSYGANTDLRFREQLESRIQKGSRLSGLWSLGDPSDAAEDAVPFFEWDAHSSLYSAEHLSNTVPEESHFEAPSSPLLVSDWGNANICGSRKDVLQFSHRKLSKSTFATVSLFIPAGICEVR
jgi:hypothetical protein